jgi:ssDNA-binding Zn-finger/Zn-ribbon topoisomerase 1
MTAIAAVFPITPEVVRMTEAASTAPLITLVCPDCNSDMVSHYKNNLEVFSCSQYPKCKKTIPARVMKAVAGK